MDMASFLGLSAGVLTTMAFIPQLLKTWKTKGADDVSMGMLATFCAGLLLWLLYGFSIQALPIILANAVTLVLASLILALKIRYSRTLNQERKGILPKGKG